MIEDTGRTSQIQSPLSIVGGGLFVFCRLASQAMANEIPVVASNREAVSEIGEAGRVLSIPAEFDDKN
ncbi:MAG: hypothetical protein ACI9G1_004906 [Pirellulaceae bacterium]|jgi:hypothetical protein